jgi:hypothetical protein
MRAALCNSSVNCNFGPPKVAVSQSRSLMLYVHFVFVDVCLNAGLHIDCWHPTGQFGQDILYGTYLWFSSLVQ